MTPAVIAALTTAIVSIVGAVVSGIIAIKAHGKATAAANTFVEKSGDPTK